MKISHSITKLLHTGQSPVATNSSTVSSLCGTSACQFLQRLLQLIKVVWVYLSFQQRGLGFFSVPLPEELSILLKKWVSLSSCMAAATQNRGLLLDQHRKKFCPPRFVICDSFPPVYLLQTFIFLFQPRCVYHHHFLWVPAPLLFS